MRKVSDIIHTRNIRIFIDLPVIGGGYKVQIDSEIKDGFTFEMSNEEFKKYSKHIQVNTYYRTETSNLPYLLFKDSGGFYEKYIPEVLL